MACAVAQEQPADPIPTYAIVPAQQQPWLHHWRLSTDLTHAEGRDINSRAGREGDSNSDMARVGLEAGIGRYGFGRIEIGQQRSDNSSSQLFLNDDGDGDATSIGASGGMFILPFLAVGGMVQYSWAHAEDDMTDPGTGTLLAKIDRDDRQVKWAPFVTVAYPIGPVELSATGSYFNIERHSDYSGSGAVVEHDRGSLSAWTAAGNIGWWIVPRLRLGAGVTWIEIADQKPQTGATPLDGSWGNVRGDLLWRTPIDGVDLALHGGHDFDNRQGNGWSAGGGLAFRF
ncbi:hypothetical protein [Dongia sedimenti]|uniref:Transporter n=1 Tax=Dongia sedimenti TaxID=3064282 RepID=A0ABU0YV61_9PROT|nr:hypothetical protein [Rhodospirillaceae bacterium R-7]